MRRRRHAHRHLGGQCSTRQRHVRPRRRNRRHASALAHASRKRASFPPRSRSANATASTARPCCARSCSATTSARGCCSRCRPMPFLRSGHHAGAFGQAFGAAAAAGALLKLDALQVRYLLSYTAQQAAGLYTMFRDPEHIEKAFGMGGMPAHNGIAAALMVAARLHRRRGRVLRRTQFLFHLRARRRPQRTGARTWTRLRNHARRHQALAGRRPDPGAAACAATT